MPNQQKIEVSPSGYALFDLDQTLVSWDMQLLFANWIFHKYPTRRLFLIFFLLALPLSKFLGARRMKRLFLAILCGLSREEVQSLTQGFANHYCPQYFYPEIIALLEEQKASGVMTILTSASPFLYVQHIGQKLGFHHTFGTEIPDYDCFPLFPEIAANNKNTVKTVRLRNWLDLKGINDAFPLPNSTAYTDSSADLPLVNISERAVLVHPSESLKSTVSETLKKPYTVHTPQRPFNDHKGHLTAAIKMLLGVYPVE